MTTGCLIIGASSRIGIELGRQLAQRQVPVWAHPVDAIALPEGINVVAAESCAAAASATLRQQPAIRTVIFDLPSLDEQSLLDCGEFERLCRDVEAQSLDFLAALQASVRHLMTVGGAQIWILVREDSFRYHLPVPTAPVLAHLRTSTVRTVAKEVARFDLRINAAALHFGAEELSPEVWRAGREGLKSYTLKYKPFAVADMAQHLLSMICNPALPMHGTVMQIGSGSLENNI